MLRQESSTFPDQTVQKQRQGQESGGKPVRKEVDIRKQNEINENQRIGYGETRETKPAPKQELSSSPAIAAKKQNRAQETGECSEQINGLCHINLNLS